MTFIQVALTIILSLNLLWWFWAHYHARHTARPRFWRRFTAAFVLVQLACLAWLYYARSLGLYMPLPLRSISYIWNGVAAPIAVVIAITITLASAALLVLNLLRRSFTRRETTTTTSPTSTPAAQPNTTNPPPEPPNLLLSRRTILTGAIAAPPVLTGLGLAKALWQLDSIRTRDLTIEVPGLHRSLDGVTIAHITDTHVGRYTTGPILREIASRVNALNADVVLFTGDLIDSSHDDLPEAISMLRAIDKPLYLCEGNHDLFGGRENFERTITSAGIPLLLPHAADLTLRGAPVQLLGIRWGSTGANRREAHHDTNTRLVNALRRDDAFPILLAHHPHAFDTAAELGIPLTLAGHTHGGQLMLSDSLGAGPALYKYWSGKYARRVNDRLAQAIVSNGTGNWFPLRLNAPAEIIKITLRRA
jgi:predicted MPP superfamily phosphohydrolase